MTDVYAWRKIGDFFSSEDVDKPASEFTNAYLTNKASLISGVSGCFVKPYGFENSDSFVCVANENGTPVASTQSAKREMQYQANSNVIPTTYLDQKVQATIKNTIGISSLASFIGGTNSDFLYSTYYYAGGSTTCSFIHLYKKTIDGVMRPVLGCYELSDDAISTTDYTEKVFIPSEELANKLIGGDWVDIEFSSHDGGAFLTYEHYPVFTLKIDGQTVFSNVRIGRDSSISYEGFFISGQFDIRCDQVKNLSFWMMYQTTPTSPTITIQKSGTTTIQLTAVVDIDPSISEAVSYSWSTGETSASITVNVPSDNNIHRYTCTATDSAGQSVTGEYTIYNPSMVLYTLLWNTGETTEIIYPEENGTYTCTVTNGAGSATASIEVTEIEGLFQFNFYPLQSSYSQQNAPNIIRTQMIDGHSRQRRMFEAAKKPAQVNCRYLMTEDDLNYWLTKWRDRLCEGSEWFLARVLADDSYTGYKQVRLINGEFEYSLQSHTEDRDLYYVDFKLEVKSA